MLLPDHALHQIAIYRQSEMLRAARRAGRLREARASQTRGRVAPAEQPGWGIGGWLGAWRNRVAAPPVRHPAWSRQPAHRSAA